MVEQGATRSWHNRPSLVERVRLTWRHIGTLTPNNVLGVSIGFDMAATCLALVVAAMLTNQPLVADGALVSGIVARLWIVFAIPPLFYLAKIYDAFDTPTQKIHRGRFFVMSRVALTTAALILVLPGLERLCGTETGLSGAAMGIYWLSLFGSLSVGRLALNTLNRAGPTRGIFKERVAIIGAGALGEYAAEQLALKPCEIECIGVYDDRAPVDGRVGDLQVKGGVATLADLARDETVDTVIIALPISAGERIAMLARQFQALSANLRIIIDADDFPLAKRRRDLAFALPTIEIFKRPLTPSDQLVKAIEDKIIAVVALTLLLPVLIPVAILIKLDSRGPVLFRQLRYGYRNELIEVFKFRTMYVDQGDQAGNQLTKRGDSRITRIGRFLRKSSIDELPQLLNVLRGEMSVVGPRPHARAASAAGVPYEQTLDEYTLRHRVKPGITGWAQANGWRGETETLDQIRNRVAHDLSYVENWSVLLDLEIIARTVWQLLRPSRDVF